MRNLLTDYPIDKNLKIVKDSEGTSTALELSKDTVRVKDLEVTGTTTGKAFRFLDDIERLNTERFTISGGTSIASIEDEDDMDSDSATSLSTQQSIKAYVDSVPLGAYSKTLIKVMPNEFFSNDDRTSQYGVIEDDTSDVLGIRMGHGAVEAYAFIKVPDGYKATHCQVLASASTSNAVICKTFNYTTGATTDLETFDFNTNENITDVTATVTNDLVIKIAPASSSTVIYGAKVTIASV